MAVQLGNPQIHRTISQEGRVLYEIVKFSQRRRNDGSSPGEKFQWLISHIKAKKTSTSSSHDPERRRAAEECEYGWKPLVSEGHRTCALIFS
jgi:hypothetical protein